MQNYFIAMLECPWCHGNLDWKINEINGDRIEEAVIICKSCSTDYLVHEGIGVFLTPDLNRNDLWKKTESGLINLLKSNSGLEEKLMGCHLDTLNPTDQFFRALILEEQGNYFEAKKVEEIANNGIYSEAYLSCWTNQIEYVIDQLNNTSDPIIDIASGRGYLIEKMARRLSCPMVATDFSVDILRRDRHWLERADLYDQISLLAFDARRTPFKNNIISNMTTNLGLPNIEQPGSLLKELHRIVSGNLWAITHFFPEKDELNGKVIRDSGLEQLLYHQTALRQFTQAGWNVVAKNTCKGLAKPTPEGEVLEGARIDGLPVSDTVLEWCVLEGTSISLNT
jgi:uncharacterized protein YbaR (Trm112 family)